MSPKVLKPPEWIKRPNGNDIANVFPARAAELGRGAQTSMRCKITAEGRMKQCVVVKEEPAGWSFGDATLSLARYFWMKPATCDGAALPFDDVSVMIPFTWHAPQ